MSINKSLIPSLILFLAVAVQAQDKPKNSDIENIGKRDINKGSVNFISPNKESAIGTGLAAEVERQVILEDDRNVIDYVNGVGRTIVINSDVPALPVTFKVIRSADLNAQVLAGGLIYVNTGTIVSLDNEAELAFVLAHHIAHIAARHLTENASKAQLINFASIPVVFMGGAGGFTLRTPSTFLPPTQFLQVVRNQVMEADFLGMQYLYKAGYEPRAAITLLQKIQRLESTSGTSEMFTATPPAAQRIAAMERNIPLILPARLQNVVNTQGFEQIKTKLKN